MGYQARSNKAEASADRNVPFLRKKLRERVNQLSGERGSFAVTRSEVDGKVAWVVDVRLTQGPPASWIGRTEGLALRKAWLGLVSVKKELVRRAEEQLKEMRESIQRNARRRHRIAVAKQVARKVAWAVAGVAGAGGIYAGLRWL